MEATGELFSVSRARDAQTARVLDVPEMQFRLLVSALVQQSVKAIVSPHAIHDHDVHAITAEEGGKTLGYRRDGANSLKALRSRGRVDGGWNHLGLTKNGAQHPLRDRGEQFLLQARERE